MRTRGVVLLFSATMAIILAGCARVQEPWDGNDHFKQERTRSAAQEKQLRERALEGETDRHTGIQQVNRT
jgi:starvation-inducible outer membrane lipoprotein